jgi:Putative transposase DNA-binding domain
MDGRSGDGPPPWFINSITTDGLQVNVTLATKVVEPLIPGVAELVEKGYTAVKEVYDATKHTRGVFGSASKLSAELLSALDEKDKRCFIEAVGVDPGDKLMHVSTAARVTSTSAPEDFKNIEPACRSSSDHKFLSLSKAFSRFDRDRRRENPAYSEAISRLSGVSMRTPGGTAAYANVMNSNFIAMAEEKLSWRRRFKSFEVKRAKMREVARMAVDIAGRSAEAAALRKIGPETEARTNLMQRMRDGLAGNLRTWTRVVFFGNALFGHGRRGPLPRKALIRAIALLVPVVLMDEFRTSMMCCGCGLKLVQVEGSRVYQCVSRTPEGENLSCSVRFIDRDINAAVNIAMCGIRMLLGLDRPQHLCRATRGEEAE